MTGLGKLIRTTAFKLSLAYLVIFALGSGAVLGWVAFSVKGLVDEQISELLETEVKGLSEIYSRGGVRRLVEAIERRAQQPGASLYLVTTFNGESIVGNVANLPPGTLNQTGLQETNYQRIGETGDDRRALARIFVLPGGFRLLVGRDLADRETLREVMGRALISSLVWLILLGTAGGLFIAWRVLRRIDAMNDTARTIMTGDMSGRLPVNGSGDELDRLAVNLNEMIARIGDLMSGLREVSDNIAHDLRTPLTRLRNHAEEALRLSSKPEEYRDALESVIEESDGLIRIFNALLLIARAEAGAPRESLADFDAAEVARDVAELYEAVAEEQGHALAIDISEKLTVHGNRELVGQAVANLVDNALKYGATEKDMLEPEPADEPAVRVAARRAGQMIEIEISDRGPGIAPADRTRVLDRFVRLEGSRSRPGSGLGLSLAVAVARLHRGALRVEDNAPGLRVIMSLPAVPEQAVHANIPAAILPP